MKDTHNLLHNLLYQPYELMSEDNNEPKINPAATQPIKKTSAVPLRKETVRVTLKAPGARPGAPGRTGEAPTSNLEELNAAPPKPNVVATPTAPLSAPATSKLDIPDVTSAVPLKQETMRVTLKADKSGSPSAPAPTIPLGGAKPAAAATPAPTMKLGGAPTVPLATQPLNTPSGPIASQPLPKATVELQKTQNITQGLGGPSQAASIKTVSSADEAKRRGAGPALPLSITAFVLSLIVFWFQFQHAKVWIDEHKGGDAMSIFDPIEE